MSRTVQQVFDAALNWSSANTDAFRNAPTREILERANYGQQSLFTKLAELNRYFFTKKVGINSTSGASARALNLAGQTLPVERVLIVKLPSGVEVNGVDVQDIEAELAPRAYVEGETLIEVNNEWGAPGVVTLTVWYAYRPAELALTATDLSQLIAVPDRFAQYLELDLAAYFAHKDFGRAGSDSTEISRLDARMQGTFQDIVSYLDHFGGPQARRFHLPVAQPGEKA